uniref:Uncharacterized protein n=1 Tax=Romanomermis culicivorax TaxID=13658 RepID=A0A915JL22_ROMCU
MWEKICMQLDQGPRTCHNMQTEQPNPKSTQFGADVMVKLLRAGGIPSKLRSKWVSPASHCREVLGIHCVQRPLRESE